MMQQGASDCGTLIKGARIDEQCVKLLRAQ